MRLAMSPRRRSVRVAGIDFSSHAIDVVVTGDGGGAIYRRVPLDGADAFDRARSRSVAIAGLIVAEYKVAAVGIEDPRGISRRADSALYRVQGAILTHIPGSVLVCPWKPSEWRRACGIAMRGKEPAAEFAGEHARWLPGTTVTQDACDAFCIAWATRQRLLIDDEGVAA